MSLDRLLFEVSRHYRSRGFPEPALAHLRWTLLSNVNPETGRFRLRTAYPGCDKSIGELVDLFHVAENPGVAPTGLTPKVAFGFAFGYQMAEWLAGVNPTDDLEVRLRRLPGKNNTALARIASSIHASHNALLYLQPEIADAVQEAPVAFSSSRKDQGTAAVAAEFIAHAAKNGLSTDTVWLLAHRHHYERCRLILKRFGVESIPTSEQYAGYDEDEAQPRVMSVAEYIVNDFASMVGMLTSR